VTRIGPAPEDFVVEELPLYPASGTGEHVVATFEKRGLTTPDAVKAIAQALGVRAEDVGVPGRKDKQAVTTQRISLPPPVTPEQVVGLTLEGIRILTAERHGHKLRTGHLAGNRFRIRLEEPIDPAWLDRVAAGMPNLYGGQRFGVRGDNATEGLAVLRGTKRARGQELRFLVSALQAELFNRYTERRRATGELASAIQGDIMRTSRGGLFASEDRETDDGRVRAGEITPTGPMFGHAMRRPAPGTLAATREDEILAEAGLTLADFGKPWLRRVAEGTRRPLTVPVAELALDETRTRLAFALPPGSFATVCVAEILGTQGGPAMLRAASTPSPPQELEEDSE
jgi:tRNA pseudouridine13 synthase